MKDVELNIKAAAAAIGCHPKTIRNWIDSGKLPAEQRGPKITRIKLSDLERFKEQYKTTMRTGKIITFGKIRKIE